MTRDQKFWLGVAISIVLLAVIIGWVIPMLVRVVPQ